METVLQDLFHMFYPLSQAQRRRWAQVVSSPEAEYRSALEREAHDRHRGCGQPPPPGALIPVASFLTPYIFREKPCLQVSSCCRASRQVRCPNLRSSDLGEGVPPRIDPSRKK